MSALRDFAKKSRPTTTTTEGPALWRGEVVEVLSNGLVWVMIPRMGGQDPIGPINTVPAGLVAGERVIVGAVGGDVNDLLVMSRVTVKAVEAPSWDDVTGKPALFPPAAHRHTYGDIDGVIPTSALPPLAVIDTFTASSQAQMLTLTAQRGDMCIRTDTFLTFVLAADDPTKLVNWKTITAAGQVTSVNGKTGTVQLVTDDINGLTTALAGKANVMHTHDITAIIGLPEKLANLPTNSLTVTAPIADWPMGISLMYGSGSVGGWPYSFCGIKTEKHHPSGWGTYQTCTNNGGGQRMARVYDQSTNAWTTWKTAL